MARVLGINAIFHDPSAALLVDGQVVAAAEEERFSRRKHGKQPVPFSAWELPTAAARWCLEAGGLAPSDLDAVAYSYDPHLALASVSVFASVSVMELKWEPLRTLYAMRAPSFLATALPGLDPASVRFVPHHVAHAASAYLMAPFARSTVMVLDGRGERTSYLGAHWDGATCTTLAQQELPHSLGLMYEELTEHLGFDRSSDEYKVMGLAAHGKPEHLEAFRDLIRTEDTGGFRVAPIDWATFAPARTDEHWDVDHANLAASVQARLEETLLELAAWLHERTDEPALTMAGGVALNCVANSRLALEGPFRDIWVQPAAGDAGTALGAAAHLAVQLGDRVSPMTTSSLGRSWSDDEIEAELVSAGVPFTRPVNLGDAVAALLAEDHIVGWFQGRSELGPRALGHRSLLGDPRAEGNLERLNRIKGREEFRPVAPMVLAERASAIFDGPLPSPFMLFTQRVRRPWLDRIPAVVHVDGTARIQTVERGPEPLIAGMLEAFERRTGIPVVINTSFNTAGRPIVDSPRDALECFGSSPIGALALGPFLVRRADAFLGAVS